jgi:hypothetical protein
MPPRHTTINTLWPSTWLGEIGKKKNHDSYVLNLNIIFSSNLKIDVYKLLDDGHVIQLVYLRN